MEFRFVDSVVESGGDRHNILLRGCPFFTDCPCSLPVQCTLVHRITVESVVWVIND